MQSTDSVDSRTEFRIRKGRDLDISLLPAVERSAAFLFRTVDLGHVADGPTTDSSLLSSMIKSGHLWVAVNKGDEPIGFIGGHDLDGYFYVAELSVAQEFQRQGVGKALIQRLAKDVKEEGFKAITLTTYRDLPWNGLWYGKLGFLEVSAEELGGHIEVLRKEGQHGHDMKRRCAMKKTL